MLLVVSFTIINTTYKNALSLSLSLTNILAKNKDTKKDVKNNDIIKKKKKKQLLVYNSILTIIVNFCLCFL